MKTTWIMVADGTKAHIYLYRGPNHPLERIPGGVFTHINKPSRELARSDRGRTMERVLYTGIGRLSAYERPTDPHTYEKYLFAKELVAFLEEQADSFDRLIIAAAPKVLGDLRHLLPDPVREKVSAELHKDLTNTPEQDLPRHFQTVLNIGKNPRVTPEEARAARFYA